VTARAPLLFLVLAVSGCVPALREPPAPADLVIDGAACDPAEIPSVLARADRLAEGRDLDSLREAARLYLRAAAADPDRTSGWIGAVRTQVRIANGEQRAESRREAAIAAVHAAQWCRRADPGGAACAFWLAVALGVQARERSSTGLDAVPRMVELLEQAIEREATLEEAGPDRVLAQVLLRAPGWPTGPGDPELGLEHARAAVALRPGYPPNQLCLAEALIENGDRDGGREAYRRAAETARKMLGDGSKEAGDWLAEALEALKDRQ
jgi:hypothetical protein